MSTSKHSKNFWVGAFVATVVFIGSVHAGTLSYSSEDFEAGTPNYTLTNSGPYYLTQLTNGSGSTISSHVALAGTDYTPGSPSRSGVWTTNDLPGTIIGEPTGKHGFVCASANRRLDSNYWMPLVSDSATSLTISFDTMVYGFDNGTSSDFTHVAAVYYSASGDFTDAQLIATYAPAAVADPGGQVLGHYTVVEDTWSTLTLTLSSSDVTFTDTARIRFNKLAPYAENNMVFYDNILVTAESDVLDYSSENFGSGIPNYTLTNSGPYYLSRLQDVWGVNIDANVALAGTDYTPGSPTRDGVWANSDLPGTIINEPTGQHGFVCNSQNRTLTSNYAMPLAADGATSLTISFDTMLYGYEHSNTSYPSAFEHVARVFYSAAGDFTDAQLIATYATADMDPAILAGLPPSILGHTTVTEDEWTKLTFTVSSTDVTFTDTAKIQFNKTAPNRESQIIFYDNIRVTGTAGSPTTRSVLIYMK